MNIALLVMSPAWGGAERHTVELALTLRGRGHTVTVVCLTEHSFELFRKHSPGEISLTCLPMPEGRLDRNLFDWLCSFARQPWNVCVLAKSWFNTGDWRVDWAARLLFGKYFTIEHSTVEPMPQKGSRRHFGIFPGLGLWWYRQWLTKFFRSIGPRKVICVSDAVGRRLIEEYRFPVRKVVTVHNGIDAQRFKRDKAAAETWRRRWGIPADSLVLGAVGRLVRIKGYETALLGFQALLKYLPEKDLHLVLVGEGPHEQALRELANRILPANRVIFSPFCDRPWEPLSAIDVFLMPSLNEAFGLALAEAMACECCPVAMAVGGIPEVVSSTELGWIVPTGDADAFTAAMVEAASQTPEQRAVVGKRAREHVVAKFNAAVQFNRLADVIESLVSAPQHIGRDTSGDVATFRLN